MSLVKAAFAGITGVMLIAYSHDDVSWEPDINAVVFGIGIALALYAALKVYVAVKLSKAGVRSQEGRPTQ